MQTVQTTKTMHESDPFCIPQMTYHAQGNLKLPSLAKYTQSGCKTILPTMKTDKVLYTQNSFKLEKLKSELALLQRQK